LAFPNAKQEESRSQSYNRPGILADLCIGASLRPSPWLTASTHNLGSKTLIQSDTDGEREERRAMKGVSEGRQQVKRLGEG